MNKEDYKLAREAIEQRDYMQTKLFNYQRQIMKLRDAIEKLLNAERSSTVKPPATVEAMEKQLQKISSAVLFAEKVLIETRIGEFEKAPPALKATRSA